MSPLLIFLNGGFAFCQLGIAAFFFHYWRAYQDRLFLWFFASFALQAINRVIIVFCNLEEPRGNVYWLRLVAYILIIIGIIEKNRRNNSNSPDGSS